MPPPPSQCIHFSHGNARCCDLNFDLPRRIQKLYNSAHGWDYGAPETNRDDWQDALPCLNFGSALLGCPFFANGMREQWLEVKHTRDKVQAPAPNSRPPPYDPILRIKPKPGRKLRVKAKKASE